MSVLRLRHRLGAARRGVHAARIVRHRTLVPYVGWVGEANVGDEAMYEAHRALLDGRNLVGITNAAGPALAVAARAPWIRCEGVCLGGGTLIGNGHFRRTFERAIGAWADAPRFAIGVGVEDPGYQVGRRADVARELTRWAPVLSSMRLVTVRGPLSRQALAELGVDAEVVGDTALLLRPRRELMPEPDLLGLNLGVVDDQWGESPDQFRSSALSYARDMIAQGWRIHLVPTFEPDRTYQRAFAEELGPRATVYEGLLRPELVIDEFARMQVLVAHKLHAAVLAGTAAVPSIALEYRPKCRDFQESVGRGDWIMRTDQLEPRRLGEWTAAIHQERERQSAELRERVEALRGTLISTAARVEALLGESADR